MFILSLSLARPYVHVCIHTGVEGGLGVGWGWVRVLEGPRNAGRHILPTSALNSDIYTAKMQLHGYFVHCMSSGTASPGI